MKQNLLNKLWLRVGMIVAVMTTALAGTAWAQSTSTLTFEARCNGSGTADDGVEWTVASDGTESVFDSTKGIHYGTSSGKVQYITLSTSDISGTITKVVVNASTASGVTATVDVTVGGDAFGGDPQSLTANAANYTFEGSAEGEIVVTVTKPSQATKAIYVKSVAVTYTSGGGSSGPTEDNDLALTGAPIALNFDLYNNSQAQTISYTTSSTGEVSVESGAYDVSCYVDESAKTITVTPMAVTNGSQTVTVNQAADGTYKAGSVTFTVTVTDSTPIATHVATFSVNGTTTTQEFEEGADIEFPENPADVSGKTFVGWVAEAIDGTTDDAPEFVTSAQMGDADVTFYAVFAYVTPGTAMTATDVLTTSTFGSPSSYTDWSGKQATDGSSAVYAGNSTTNNGNIQMRASSPSGVVSTTSGGKVKKVTVKWASNTADGRTVWVFGKNEAYTSSSQLYNDASDGDLLGSIVYGTSTELEITKDYAYVGFRSSSNALYLENVTIEWEAGTPDTYSNYCTTVVAAAVERPVIVVAENPFLFTTTATITCETEGASIKYSFDGENWNDYTEALTITATTTIYAKAVKGEDESDVASVTATKNLAVPSVAIDATGITNTNVYDGTEAGSLSASVTYNDEAIEGAVVTWSSSDEEVATIDENGVVTLVGAGSVTFTATYAGNDDYSEKTATYVMTVINIDPNAPGTENNPYTVAEARDAVDAGTGVTNVYATGIVSEIVTEYSSQHSNITFDIVDFEGATVSLRAYRCTGTDAADVRVGDVVVISGNLMLYNSSIYEFAQGCVLVSLTHPVITTPCIEVSTTTVEATAAGLDGTIDVTYNNLTDVLAEVQFVEADGTTSATYDWVAADFDASNNVEYLIEENTSTEARTAYMKVYAVGNEGDAYSELITITQAGYVVDYATLPFVWEGSAEDGKSSLEAMAGVTANGLGTDYAVSNAPYRVKLDGTGDYIQVQTDCQPVLVSLDVKMLGGSNPSTITVQESADGENFTDVEDLAIEGVQNDVLYLQTASAFDAATRYVRLYFTKGSNVGVGGITIEKEFEEIATVGEAGYATYVTKHNVAFPADVAYIGAVNENSVLMTAVTAVPKGTPLILKGEGTYTLSLASASELAGVSGNELKASETEVVANGTQYVLAKPANEPVGFYQAEEGSTIAAGKAYLEIANADVKAFTFSFEDDATGLSDMSDMSDQSDIIFNLAGQRVQKMQKGINIVNGKKVLR